MIIFHSGRASFIKFPGNKKCWNFDFIKLVVVAIVIAVPVAWFTTSNWLQGYAFRINLQWTYFVLPFIMIIAIALITVSFQSIKAAVANPVKSLRTE